VRRADAEQFGLRKLSDLATFPGRFRLAAIYEFYERPEWRSFQRLYGAELFKERLSMEMSLFYEAIKAKQIDVISTNSTDGRIAVYDLVVLEDDRHAIPPYDAMILVSSKLAREHPEAVDTLRSLDKAIDAERMQRMNKEVDQDKRVPKDVAKEFLKTLR
jgi:osmoprotectant transport system permease protein